MRLRLGTILALGAVWFAGETMLAAAELTSSTVAAFDRYVQLTEARIQTEVAGDHAFLWVDRLNEEKRSDALGRLRRGEVLVERLETRDGDRTIKIPKGLVHHWVGTVLIPGVTVGSTIAMVRNYDQYAQIYDPNVRRASILERNGNRFSVYAQLYMKKVLTAVLDTEYDAEFVTIDDRRVYVPSRTTRILEVDRHDTPEETRRPEGNDRGFLWRFNNYCSFEEREEGTYMQCESVSLSRGLPFLVGALVKPFVTSIPKETMTFTLTAAREHLTDQTIQPDDSPGTTSKS
jgi:hypothetical protein